MYEEHTYYGTFVKVESSFDQLPINIRTSLDRILKRYLGEYSKATHFRNVQVIDLEKCFRLNTPGDRVGVVPAYEVHYYVTVPTAGIKKYNIHIKLDQYGQLLAINWPEDGYHDFRDFKDTSLIRLRALAWAANQNIQSRPYTIHFYFDHINQHFVWEFDFFKNAQGFFKGIRLSAKTGATIDVIQGRNLITNCYFPKDTDDVKTIRKVPLRN